MVMSVSGGLVPPRVLLASTRTLLSIAGQGDLHLLPSAAPRIISSNLTRSQDQARPPHAPALQVKSASGRQSFPHASWQCP